MALSDAMRNSHAIYVVTCCRLALVPCFQLHSCIEFFLVVMFVRW